MVKTTCFALVISCALLSAAHAQAPKPDLDAAAAAARDVGAQVAAARVQHENMLKSIDAYIALLKQDAGQATAKLRQRDAEWAEYSRPLWQPPGTSSH